MNTNERLGMNLAGRLEAIQYEADKGDDAAARRHIISLLKFFPPVEEDDQETLDKVLTQAGVVCDALGQVDITLDELRPEIDKLEDLLYFHDTA